MFPFLLCQKSNLCWGSHRVCSRATAHRKTGRKVQNALPVVTMKQNGDGSRMTSKCVSEAERKKHLYQRFMVVVGEGGRSVVHSPVSISGDGLAGELTSAFLPCRPGSINEENKKSKKKRIALLYYPLKKNLHGLLPLPRFFHSRRAPPLLTHSLVLFPQYSA